MLLGCLTVLACPTQAGDATDTGLELRPMAQIGGEGLFLNEIVTAAGTALPALRLTNAPAFGQALVLTRAQLSALLQKHASEWATTNFTGATAIRITRRALPLIESDLTTLLTETLQKQQVKDRGVLELHLTRAWTTLSVPDEPLTMKILDLPTSGVTPSFIVRFELATDHETLGVYQAAVRAGVWQEIWVARNALKRGETPRVDDLALERRDLLKVRDPLTELPAGNFAYEFAEAVGAGMPLSPRAFRLKPLVRRGQSADALVRQGALTISLKVEVLEDGAPGEFVRARNLQSNRIVRGKVIDEHMLLVSL